jgi:hypothetical protein
MRIRLILAALAAAAVPATAAALPAMAATPSCGTSCVDVFSSNFGTSTHPGFVLDAFKQGQKAGTPVILFRTSNTDPAEDFTVSTQGLVSDFYKAGLVSSQVALHYGCVPTKKHPCSGTDDEAYELEYAPYGAETGLCAAAGTVTVAGSVMMVSAAAGDKVTLQPCGVTATTVWIVDTFDAQITAAGIPLINGADMNFSHPLVLTYPASSYPTDMPRPQLYLVGITGSANGSGGPVLGTVDDNQLWSAVFGKVL